MESNLKNMVLCLLSITLVAALALGAVYGLTKDTIAAAKSAKTVESIAEVLPPFDNDPSVDTLSLVIDNIPARVYIGRSGGNITGYAVETATRQGFSGEIKMMVGFNESGTVNNIVVLEHNETPGLGSKMTEPGNVLLVAFTGKNPSDINMKVRKDGGDIDAITASTISSRAYIDAVGRAYEAFQAAAYGIEPEDKSVDIFAKVLPPHDNQPRENGKDYQVDGRTVKVYAATEGGQITGYAVETTTYLAYHDEFTLLVGFTPDGTITDVAIVSQEETPGFGGEIEDEGNPLQESFKGMDASSLKYSLRSEGGDVDGITSATVTSVAYIDAVKAAYAGFLAAKKDNAYE